MAKLLMNPEVKPVSCLGGPPSSGTLQMFSTPEVESRYARDFPSGTQPNAIGWTVRGRSIVFTALSSLTETRPSFGWLPAWSSGKKYAISFPSGEKEGNSETRLVICTGAPPSIGTSQTERAPRRSDVKTTERPSGEQTGYASPLLPVVSCLGFEPSIFIRQMFRLPARSD